LILCFIFFGDAISVCSWCPLKDKTEVVLALMNNLLHFQMLNLWNKYKAAMLLKVGNPVIKISLI
jgi:hypothetical protein